MQKLVGAPNAKLPNHLFDDDGTIVRGIHDKLKVAREMVERAARELNNAIAATLRLISVSEDIVSKMLSPLFATAAAHQPDELERARVRNVRGIPPGKKVGPVGDELNWEQFLSFVKKRDKRRLWIISKDSDYCLTHGKDAVFLGPTLHQELMSLTNSTINACLLTNIPDGISHFARTTCVRADKLPSPAKTEQIKKEQQKLPPVGWTEEDRKI